MRFELLHFTLLARVATIVAFCVIVLGAYVRLSDAGLGCPDWPGCYGKLLGVPETAAEIEQAQENYPLNRVDPPKAWKEVLHRYLAGFLSLLVFALAALAVANRRHTRQPVAPVLALAALIVLQAVLGMWTVTLLLKPVVVTAHLLGGFATLALLGYLALPATDSGSNHLSPVWQRLAWAGVGVLTAQITLGGWTASNYAALACPDFPTCHQQWWPPMDFGSAFDLGDEPGTNYEFGVLDSASRTAIHVTHRIGALLTVFLLGGFLIALLLGKPPTALRVAAASTLALLALQTLLGILNVTLSLPLFVATTHNGTAALLLLSLTTLARMLKSQRKCLPHPPQKSFRKPPHAH